ncbi:MAG: hypothetical protein QNJ33_16885 [Crocosphaera sp.]|nr:hypothetical protein [Crocosphaera sp.]
MKPNFETMSKDELKAYVLEHRNDTEAIRYLFRISPDVKVKTYPPVCTEDGVPIEENIRIMEQAIQDRIRNKDY